MTPDNSINNQESQSLAKRLRNEDPEQFQTLVRMHLSFVLDLQSEETDGPQEKSKQKPLKWSFVPFSKKIRGLDKELIEGVPLTNDMISQIFQLIDFLSQEENISQEGIFRRSGKMTRQQELKNLITQGVKLNLDDGSYSVHDVATVLKGFLAELPEPLLTETYYPAYCQIADLCHDNCSKSRVTKSLQLLLLLLPHENRRILRRILLLLHETANHVETNLMSAQNLATLFTPHLLCPRKLSPEVFHTTAQNLSCIVVYMIKEGVSVFEVPEALATDIKAYWDRRIRTPNMLLESSITEAKTVFSFVDRQKSEQEKNPTETALAQLYAHIQSLPESNKKKKLIKQFNKENGNGTPRTKSLGINIKKHIFSKNLGGKNKGLSEYAQFKNDFGVVDECNSPDKKRQARTPKLKLLSCTEDLRNKRSPSEDSPKTPKGNFSEDELFCTPCAPRVVTPPEVSLLTSTPAIGLSTPVNVPELSPITRSTQRMPKAMQEAMITPRSRKPVMAFSGTNLQTNSAWVTKELSLGEKESEKKKESQDLTKSGGEESSLTSPFRDYLFSRSVLTASPVDLSFSSRTGDYDPSSSTGDTQLEEIENILSESLINSMERKSPPSSTTSSGSRHKRERSDESTERKIKKTEAINESEDETSSFITETSL